MLMHQEMIHLPGVAQGVGIWFSVSFDYQLGA